MGYPTHPKKPEDVEMKAEYTAKVGGKEKAVITDRVSGSKPGEIVVHYVDGVWISQKCALFLPFFSKMPFVS